MLIGINKLYKFSFIFALTLLFLPSCKTSKKATSETKEKPENKNKHTTLQLKYAEILNTDQSSITNIKLYTFIDEWLGTPYKYGGKTKEGIDCSDFTVVLCKEVYNKTLEVPATKIYSLCKPIDISEIQEGDLVFFKIDGGKISHVGIYLQNNKFIHASTKKGVIINDLNEAYYKKYFYKAGRIK